MFVLKVSLVTYVCSIISDFPKDAAGDSEDFFAFGLDSIQTVELANGLRTLLHPHLDPKNLTSTATKVVMRTRPLVVSQHTLTVS